MIVQLCFLYILFARVVVAQRSWQNRYCQRDRQNSASNVTKILILVFPAHPISVTLRIHSALATFNCNFFRKAAGDATFTVGLVPQVCQWHTGLEVFELFACIQNLHCVTVLPNLDYVRRYYLAKAKCLYPGRETCLCSGLHWLAMPVRLTTASKYYIHASGTKMDTSALLTT